MSTALLTAHADAAPQSSRGSRPVALCVTHAPFLDHYAKGSFRPPWEAPTLQRPPDPLESDALKGLGLVRKYDRRAVRNTMPIGLRADLPQGHGEGAERVAPQAAIPTDHPNVAPATQVAEDAADVLSHVATGLGCLLLRKSRLERSPNNCNKYGAEQAS
ncbi:MAG: hypothetical protein ACKPKO_62540, partial [Candidatus Fonsibacter sp.]